MYLFQNLLAIKILCILPSQVLPHQLYHSKPAPLGTTETVSEPSLDWSFIIDQAAALEVLGYSVRLLPGGQLGRPAGRLGHLVALDGDVAISSDKLLSQVPHHRSGLWLDDAGGALLPYYVDSWSQPDVAGFTKALRSWTEGTCLRVVRLPDGPCDRPVRRDTLCVGNFTGCWSYVGNQQLGRDNRRPQLLSLDHCGPAVASHQLGHMLGLHHQHRRADRDHALLVRPEHSVVRRLEGGGRRQASRCPTDRLATPPPTPYDYLSVMQLRTSAFADEDQRAVIIARNPHRQYLTDYRTIAGLRQSHLDFYTVNSLYGCQRSRAAACAIAGRQTPTCRHFGYLSADCRCRCAVGFSGPSCEIRTGSMFPPMVKAVLVDVNATQTVHLTNRGMTTGLGDMSDYFRYVQFFSMSAISPTSDTHVSVGVTLTSFVFNLLTPDQVNSLISNLPNEHELLLLTWGHPGSGALRSECFTSVARNETTGPVLRGRGSQLSLTISSAFGRLLRKPSATILLLEGLSLDVVFARRADMVLKVSPHGPAGSTGPAGPVGPVSQSRPLAEAAAAAAAEEAVAAAEEAAEEAVAAAAAGGVDGALRAPSGRQGLTRGERLVVAVGAVTIALLLVLSCSATAGMGCSRRKREEREEQREE